jgi:hypothetical protein
MSSAALLFSIPLAWLAVTLLVVAACRATALAEAEGPRPPDGGAGGLGAVSSTTSCAGPPARRALALTPLRQQLPATLSIGGELADSHTARVRRQPSAPEPVSSH